MANMYREKNCPACGEPHRKRGPFCSQSCASKGLVHTEETKKKLRKITREYLQTPEGVASAKLNTSDLRMPVDEYAVSVPDLRDIRDYDFLENYPTDW